jgi:hypothetical protein
VGDELVVATFPASGSSWKSFARGGEAVTIRDSPVKKADLDAELVGLVRLAFANALNLGSVQAVDLGTALAALLIAHPPGEGEPAATGALS